MVNYQLIVNAFGGDDIFLSMISKESEVGDFLERLKGILEKDDFNVDQNLILIQKKKPRDEEHSTPYTLVDLEYDLEDVIARIKELTISE